MGASNSVELKNPILKESPDKPGTGDDKPGTGDDKPGTGEYLSRTIQMALDTLKHGKSKFPEPVKEPVKKPVKKPKGS